MNRMLWLLSFIRGKIRIKLGFCPMCNSDAPELYDCPTCNYYSSASGDEFPPPKEIRKKWWKSYKDAVDAKLFIRNIIDDHKAP